MGTTRTFGRLCGTALTRAAAVLAGVAVAGVATGAAFAAQDVAFSTAERHADALRIDGGIAGVVAGAPTATLTLTLTNDGDAPRRVRSVRAESTGVTSGPRGCDGYLTLGRWAGDVTVAGHGTATVTLPVAVSAGLPATCETVVWGLLYTAD